MLKRDEIGKMINQKKIEINQINRLLRNDVSNQIKLFKKKRLKQVQIELLNWIASFNDDNSIYLHKILKNIEESIKASKNLIKFLKNATKLSIPNKDTYIAFCRNEILKDKVKVFVLKQLITKQK